MEINKLFWTAAIAFFGLAVTSCSDAVDDEPACKEPVESPYVKIPLDGDTRGVVECGNDFAVRFLATAFDQKGNNGDVCVSPLSAFMTLAMMANGDNSETRAEILDVIWGKDGGSKISDVNNYCRVMNDYLPALDNSTTVGIANSLWVNEGVTVENQLADILSEYYLADTFSENLSSKKGTAILNSWIKEKTSGLIDKFLEDPLNVELAFVNASYFNGSWSETFNKDNTEKSVFHRSDGSEISMDFMRATRDYKYVNRDGVKAVSLPYGNGNYEMTIVSPDEWSPVSEWLTKDKLNGLLNTAESTYVSIRMPKFSHSSKGNILSVLNALGIRKACEEGFNAMVNEGDVKLSLFLHGVDIKVDEEGTEGAAVSVGGLENSAGPLPEPIVMSLDHPFVYFVRETSTGSIIFAGTMSNPLK